MSLTIIYRKLQELKEKEKKIQDFYDPIKVHKVQHPHIQDLRDDYQEDIQNYGFSRFAFKEEKEASLDDRDRRIQSAVPFNNRITSPKGNVSQYSSIKPQSAQMRPTTAKKLTGEGGVTFQNQLASPKSLQGSMGSVRPTTAKKFGLDATVQSEFQMTSPKTIQSQFLNSMRPQTAAIQSNLNIGQAVRNIQSANQNGMQRGYDTINDRFMPEEEEDYQQDDELQDQQENNQAQETGKKIKHWKFTKKYDTNGKQAVRNQSALRKIVMDGQDGQEQVQDEEEIQQIHERSMANRLNGQKIFIAKDGQVLENRENHEVNILRKYSPTEREKLNFLDSFQSQKQFLSQGDVQFRKIYASATNQNKEESRQSSSKKLPTNENLMSDPSQRGHPSSLKQIQSQAGQRKKQERPQTAVGFSNSGNSNKNNNTSSKAGNVHFKKRIHSSRPYSASGEQIKVFTEEEQKMFNLKKIKSAVLDQNGPHKFFAAKDYSPIELTEWYFPNQQKDFSFKVVVIDMKTMNFIKYDNVKVINNQLVHTTYKEEHQEIQFEKIFSLLARLHQPTHHLISPQSFFHVLIYQKLASDEETILYEKFVFKGTVQITLEPGILNILLLYYIRYILCFDPSDINFKSIFDNSLYILEKKRAIPSPLYDFISSLQSKAIYIEDINQKTQQFYVFPQLQAQLLVEETKIRTSFHSNQSPGREIDFNELRYKHQQDAHNLNYPFSRQQNDTEGSENLQIKRPTTANPYSSYSSPSNNNYQYNSAQQEINNNRPNAYQNSTSSYQGSLQQQLMQKQLPFLNQNLIPSSSQSQLNTQHLLQKYQSNQQLSHHLSHSNLLQNPQANSSLTKPSLPLDYTKHGQQKLGLRPKTAVSKGIRSPSSASFSATNSGAFNDIQKRHQINNQVIQIQEQLKSDGKKYEKNVKGFSSPMFIKGQQVKPSFNREIGIYQLSQH